MTRDPHDTISNAIRLALTLAAVAGAILGLIAGTAPQPPPNATPPITAPPPNHWSTPTTQPMRLYEDGSGTHNGQPFCLNHRLAQCHPTTHYQPTEALTLWIHMTTN